MRESKSSELGREKRKDMVTRDQLMVYVALSKQVSTRSGMPEWQRIAERCAKLLTEYDAAVSTKNTGEAERAANELVEYGETARAFADTSQSRPLGFWAKVGAFILFAVFAGLLWFIAYYISSLGAEKLSTIEATRPLLVVTAIVSTIAFGGALLVGSLFTSEGTYEDRFRHAREIFLVFSGVFGTVLGFYFGAGDSSRTLFGLDATLEDATLVAYATGGTAPYKFVVTYGPKGQSKTADTSTGFAVFSFDKAKDDIRPLRITVSDAKNTAGSKLVDISVKDLKDRGWKLADAEPAAPAPGASQPPSPNRSTDPKQPSAASQSAATRSGASTDAGTPAKPNTAQPTK